MALPKADCDREFQKFVETDAGEVAVRVQGTFVNLPAAGTTTKNIYNDVSSVDTTQTTIVSYTVPPGKTLYLSQVEYGGGNIARYDIEVDSTLEARRRTYYAGGMSGKFEFEQFRLTAGQVIELKVKHENATETADFEGRIVGLEV